MKKRIALLLVLVMIILCGCTGVPLSGESSHSNPEEQTEDPNTPTPSMATRFAIGREFILYLDEEKNILWAEAENEEEKALFAQLELAGKPYAEALSAILDAAYTQGDLKEGSEIHITVDIPQFPSANLGFMSLPVFAFQREKGIAIHTVIHLSPDPHTKNTSVVIDGRKYNVMIEPLYGGDSTADNLVEVGTIMKYISKNLTEEDDPNSYSKKEVVQFFNGDTWVTYYRNDSCLRSLKVSANGEVYDVSYRSDGSEIAYYTVLPNGDYNYFLYTEDGSFLEAECLMDGCFSTGRCQDDGTVYQYNVEADGFRYESLCRQDGTTVYTAEYDPNGESRTKYYDDNGNIRKMEETIGDDCVYSSFDENGNLIGVERKNADGSWTESIFDSSGNTIAWREYDADGVLINSFGEESDG